MLKKLAPLILILAAPALAQPQVARPVVAVATSPQQIAEAALAAAPRGTRFGLLVLDEGGRVLVAINPDMRFVPASNTKLYTTAAALALLPGMDQPDAAGGTEVYLRPAAKGPLQDVVLYGRGDALLSSAADCKVDCLATLADAVAAKTRVVGDVIGDDRYFPDQRWSAGMSWNNIGDYNATAASALSLDANELTVRLSPGAKPGDPAVLTAPPYLTVRSEVTTTDGKTEIEFDHPVNSRNFRLYGQIALGAGEWRGRFGIDDPAHYAASQFAAMLRARGVTIKGTVRAQHQPVQTRAATNVMTPAHDMAFAAGGPPLASLVPPSLASQITLINKPSQNHYAELLLRRIARLNGTGSVEDGLETSRALFLRIGLPAEGFDLYDGSGMSTYNRVSPRATASLLRWGLTQSWGALWLDSFPVAGRDGTLKRRFAGTALEGQLRAKTGTLNATNALAGVMPSAGGRRLIFAFYANDVPSGASAIPVMEQVLVKVAAGS